MARAGYISGQVGLQSQADSVIQTSIRLHKNPSSHSGFNGLGADLQELGMVLRGLKPAYTRSRRGIPIGWI